MPRNELNTFEKETRHTIAQNLKRLTKNITQSELSLMTNIPKSTLSGYFAERSTPHPGNVQKIADALNVKKSDIDPRFLRDNGKENYWELTEKDNKDIGKALDKLIADITNAGDSNSSDGAFSLYGNKLDKEDLDKIRYALEMNLRMAKEEAKKKYTPKKNRI
ncbi:helix-turn-helix domain-containing protein [Listeria seeligeri]|uniref:helix-turn-helix domain-containing protein n=1 Tax=Listeria seeligeri TaxID=1640 RepID=UPI0022EC1502|nr:helix-turn-helix transcriptional regulator [Listeria seeligeri]